MNIIRIQKHRMMISKCRLYIAMLLLLFVFYSNQAYCQKDGPEKIHVHFDKSFYLVGEKMHFKVYFMNKNIVQSKIVHVDIIDAAGRVHMKQIMEIDRNTASGSFEIPYNLAEGNYLFRCFTQWNLNFGSSYIYYKIIPVFNEFIDDTNLEFTVDTTSMGEISFATEDSNDQRKYLKITNQGTIHRGDLVEVEIDIEKADFTGPASLSMAVLQLNAFDQNEQDLQFTVEELRNDKLI